MKICPITLEPVEGGGLYSLAGLRAVDPRLENLLPLHLTLEEQLREARLRADKMSIQGVQPKLSAVLKAKEGCFEIVDRGGKFWLDLNPMTHLAVSYQEILFYNGPFGHWRWLLAIAVASALLFLFGYFLFDRLRDSFAEEV